MNKNIGAMICLTISLLATSISHATNPAFVFSIRQNTIWEDILVSELGCQKTQGSQTCVVGLRNIFEGGITQTCDGSVFNKDFRHSCYVPSVPAGQPIRLVFSIGASSHVNGACEIFNGQTVLIRSLCNGVPSGFGDACPGGTTNSTFVCETI